MCSAYKLGFLPSPKTLIKIVGFCESCTYKDSKIQFQRDQIHLKANINGCYNLKSVGAKPMSCKQSDTSKTHTHNTTTITIKIEEIDNNDSAQFIVTQMILNPLKLSHLIVGYNVTFRHYSHEQRPLYTPTLRGLKAPFSLFSTHLKQMDWKLVHYAGTIPFIFTLSTNCKYEMEVLFALQNNIWLQIISKLSQAKYMQN